MNHYLATFTQHDGEHEHIERVVAMAASDESAHALCASELYECGDEAVESLFSYGDGTTAVSEFSLDAISESDYRVLSKYLSCLAETSA